MGGSRFVGKALVSKLISNGHQLTLFTRGNRRVPLDVEHLKGDRTSTNDLKLLQGRSFDVIVDSSGRSQIDTEKVLTVTGNPNLRFLYVSSAGVYANTNYWPLTENSELDPASRHKGKAETEEWLSREEIPFTSFRPTYIYGPGNYNPIERWFFDRIVNKHPVPVPKEKNTITQLGHVNDLAEAMVTSLDIDSSKNRIYNCSGKFGVTFQELIKAASIACNVDPQTVEIREFDPSSLDLNARKAFPLRINHFLTDISRIEKDLNWEPKYDLKAGLHDSYVNDYLVSPTIQPDFSIDQTLFGI